MDKVIRNGHVAVQGGLRDLTIKWVPEGTQFRVHEYDGSETVILDSEEKWFMA